MAVFTSERFTCCGEVTGVHLNVPGVSEGATQHGEAGLFIALPFPSVAAQHSMHLKKETRSTRTGGKRRTQNNATKTEEKSSHRMAIRKMCDETRYRGSREGRGGRRRKSGNAEGRRGGGGGKEGGREGMVYSRRGRAYGCEIGGE